MNKPNTTEETRATGPIDFDAIYREESQFRPLIGNLTPWDIGEAQPAVIDLERRELIEGDVLDAGCGLGDNAIFLAGLRYRVTAFDTAADAVSRAQERARACAVEMDFRVADATRLSEFEGRYDTVVDSALYHCLGEREREQYVGALHGLGRRGTLLHILCFSDARPKVNPALQYISASELRRVLTGGWEIKEFRTAGYATAFSRADIERSAVAFGRDPAEVLATFQVDERGRFLAPAWLVTAEWR